MEKEKVKGGQFRAVASTVFSRREMGAILPLLALLFVVAFVNPNFYKSRNLIDILRTTSLTFILGAPLTMLMITGNRDLSIAATTALGGVVCAWGFSVLNIGVIPSILLGLLSGFLVGFVKATICKKLNISPFIITLGLQYIINGFLMITTLGNPITGFPDAFQKIGQGKLFGSLYFSILMALGIGLACAFVLKFTRFGRETYATGGNRETARLAGINTQRVLFVNHILVSVFAAFVGILYASRFNSAQYNAGAGTEMTIMCAAIIGGTSFAGGVGTIGGTFFGCLLLACINNALVLMRVSTYWQNLVFGIILLIALFIDKIRTDKSGGALA